MLKLRHTLSSHKARIGHSRPSTLRILPQASVAAQDHTQTTRQIPATPIVGNEVQVPVADTYAAIPATPQAPAKDSRTQAKLAFLGAWLASGLVCFTELSQNQDQLPHVPDWVWQSLPSACAALMLTPLALKAVMGDKFHLELHRGRIWVQFGIPSQGPLAPMGSVMVRPTLDGRGNGAVATALLPAGTHLCDYEGELLTAQQYNERYIDGVSDFAMSVDDYWVIDAAHLVDNTSQFKAVHMNHSQTRANVVRYYNRSAKRISFFTTRDIMIGEELLFNYGRNYWRGREHMELP